MEEFKDKNWKQNTSVSHPGGNESRSIVAADIFMIVHVIEREIQYNFHIILDVLW